MQQSNGYIIGFSAILTVVLGGLLAFVAVSLKDRQQREVELETKKQILSAVMKTEGVAKSELEVIYNNRIKAVAVNIDGEEIEPKDKFGDSVTPDKVNIKNEYSKASEERTFPVFKYMSESDPNKVEAYILPMYGSGLWNDIWGYISVQSDLNTVAGVSFDHVGETPGLGARITTAEVQQRYQGKKLFDVSGELKSVMMVKGENHTGLGEHEVDGMSGATITGKGVNDMVTNYMSYYTSFFKSLK
ncbi:NADH:ubiquinone reductase (Na(+)-transporting) subunit C [Flammeovirgaceae bacterium SG7u.111]|nr:NADH:ubiquinone reductase (Na(+)-transporting) subunit C [Flammeovirgaceae bacterium SG7u.132]WPO38705.1 NADH:ubiquinone reductase (Na(+)-transporting) subunit C [Flammeovirgaceae bacterium SG7u.111]